MRGATCRRVSITLPRTFQSALPLRGATEGAKRARVHFEFQSALPLRGATGSGRTFAGTSSYFNPRSPCGERPSRPRHRCLRRYFNPRSPCGERPRDGWRGHSAADFNPRSPCGERPVGRRSRIPAFLFQSALPLRGATPVGRNLYINARISIRAPLAGSDLARPPRQFRNPYFNPRSPCGERPVFSSKASLLETIFQSALPLRGATGLRASRFQSALPCGERRSPVELRISIRAPLAGSDRYIL